ncbi:hypothetical protein F0562_030503 [Nyssa sinensis]|uniref:NAC domain-containing protein n=1 Tax=Nyssa sinensis TaxID=561372 RepID=A0A5J5AYZ3_9ASTE|nr:hypothetical protein F0562_030503 [Nyssa sinensis]
MEDQFLHTTSSSSSSLIVFNANVAYLNSFPPCYRFRPRDEEIIVHYLKKKVNNEVLPLNPIHDDNIYKYDPQTLTEKYQGYREKVWYFFTPRERRHQNGQRPNRAVGDGYWKATSGDKAIKFKGVDVGFRKALVYYTGKPPKGEKTNWIMHEYTIYAPPKSQRVKNDMRLDDWVLCRIYKRADHKSVGRGNPHLDDESPILPTEEMLCDHEHISMAASIAMNSDYNINVEPDVPQPLSLSFDLQDQAMTSTSSSHPNANMIQDQAMTSPSSSHLNANMIQEYPWDLSCLSNYSFEQDFVYIGNIWGFTD